MFGHKQGAAHGAQWIKVQGKALDLRNLPGPRAPHPKVLTVELYPQGGDPVRTEVHLVPGDRHRWDDDLYLLVEGDIVGFLYDPVSGEARYDMTDPRNSMTAHTAASDAFAAMLDTDEPLQPDTGPPWIVTGRCLSCNAPVDQRWASAQPQPRCTRCGQFLLAYPLVTGNLRRDSLS